MISEIRVPGFYRVDTMGLTGARYLTDVVRTQNEYQKADTYEHSLQTLEGGTSSSEEGGGLTTVKKCKISSAAFVLAGTSRASTCWELVLRVSRSGEGLGGPESDISSTSSIPCKLNSSPLPASGWVVAA
jgi:hypothetical protein